jgi:hypothetical protein
VLVISSLPLFDVDARMEIDSFANVTPDLITRDVHARLSGNAHARRSAPFFLVQHVTALREQVHGQLSSSDAEHLAFLALACIKGVGFKTLVAIQRASLAIVGTREPSGDGRWLGGFIGGCLAHWAAPTVSGLALGIAPQRAKTTASLPPNSRWMNRAGPSDLRAYGHLWGSLLACRRRGPLSGRTCPHKSPRLPQHVRNLAPPGDCFSRIMSVFEGVLVTLWGAWGHPAMHSATAVRHRWRPAPAPAPCPGSASRAVVH